ncbi:LLM class flavin-dependent oxidoreductase [Iamia majanohamensis]|uniref:LLM class flavin-dependent oxidoreductase n=1 Tax=Iamia majanohamensis TaxID=467976 RepID=A0AAE9Y819_9ACTN|nr:LLM class flavin-dependent oxidoreductase [Iamia majanohamensis]WCO66163.1 LLM class flavin-dependent oxidoreductase [Iamia majanohamensis]
MEFGVFAQLFVPRFERDRDPLAEHRRIMRNVEIAKAADADGFKYVWCPQHHFLDEYSHMPGPEAFLAFCAAQTERVHLGSAIFNITPPVNTPVRVAENVALLDHLTDNRFEFGTGRGSSSTEVLGFGIPSVDDTKAMWRETIREIPRMWRDEPYSYEGASFSVPERKIFPCPHGTGHPAMWVAAGSPGTFTEAGEMGLGAFCFALGKPSQMEPLLRSYKDAVGGATPVGDYVNDNIMGVTNMLCMEDRAKAFEVASDMGMNYYSTLAYHWLDNVPRPSHLPEWPAKIPEPTPEQVEQLSAEGYVAIGDPDDCARSVQRWVDLGFDQLTFSPTTNTLPTDLVLGSMELFGREVIPRFDTDPVHSTTRYREAYAASVGGSVPGPVPGLDVE